MTVRSTELGSRQRSIDLEIEARRRQAGTAGNQQVTDMIAVVSEVEALDRVRGEFRRVRFEIAHAVRGRGEVAANIESVAVDDRAVWIISGGQERIAVIDARPHRHALEDGRAAVSNIDFGEVLKSARARHWAARRSRCD